MQIKVFALMICSIIIVWLLPLFFGDISDKDHTVLSTMFTLLMFIFIYIKSLKIDLKNKIYKIIQNFNVNKIIKLFLAALLFQAISTLLNNMINILLPIKEDTNFYLSENKLFFVISCFNIIVLGPIFEEILFRKTLYSSLTHHYNEKKANIIQACIFSMYHLSILAFLSYFMAGYILGIIYKREKNIMPPIIFHGFVNLIAIIANVIIYISFYKE